MAYVQAVMIAAVVGLLAAPAAAATALVSNTADSGAGSFRAAVEAANSDPAITSIRFRRDLGTIEFQSTVTYTGTQALTIDGRGTEIAPPPQTLDRFDLFIALGGGDLTLRSLTFQDGDNGIVVMIPGLAEGPVSVSLLDVNVVDNLRFGLTIDEEDPGEAPFAASINLVVVASHFNGNGLLEGADEDEGDVDAVRVNERGEGDIMATVLNSEFVNNGADGFELDEEGPGDVTMMTLNSTFDENGLTREGGDDGLDIDESEDGGIWLKVVGSTFKGSTDDGIGLDESGEGDLEISLEEVKTSANHDSGISADEADSGDFEIRFVRVSSDENVDKGADFSEGNPDVEGSGEGDFDGRIVASSFSDNADDGIAVVQLEPGIGVLRLVNVALDGNDGEAIDAEGVKVIVLGGSSSGRVRGATGPHAAGGDVVLERGYTQRRAPRNAASYLISRALRMGGWATAKAFSNPPWARAGWSTRRLASLSPRSSRLLPRHASEPRKAWPGSVSYPSLRSRIMMRFQQGRLGLRGRPPWRMVPLPLDGTGRDVTRLAPTPRP